MMLLAKSYDGYFARENPYFVILSEAKNLPCSGCLGEILRFAQNDNDWDALLSANLYCPIDLSMFIVQESPD